MTTPVKHPLYWKVKAHLHALGEATTRSLMAQQLARQADDELARVLIDAGLDRQAIQQYVFDDDAETITRKKDDRGI